MHFSVALDDSTSWSRCVGFSILDTHGTHRKHKTKLLLQVRLQSSSQSHHKQSSWVEGTSWGWWTIRCFIQAPSKIKCGLNLLLAVEKNQSECKDVILTSYSHRISSQKRLVTVRKVTGPTVALAFSFCNSDSFCNIMTETQVTHRMCT